MVSTSLALTNICRASIAQASTIGIQRALTGSAVKALSQRPLNPLHHTTSTSPRRFLSSTRTFQLSTPTRPFNHQSLFPHPTILFARTFYSLTRSNKNCTDTAAKAAAKRKALRDAHTELDQYLTEKLSSYYVFQIQNAYSGFATSESIKETIRVMQQEDARKTEKGKEEKDKEDEICTQHIVCLFSLLGNFLGAYLVWAGHMDWCFEKWGWGREEDANIGSRQTRRASLDCSGAKA